MSDNRGLNQINPEIYRTEGEGLSAGSDAAASASNRHNEEKECWWGAVGLHHSMTPALWFSERIVTTRYGSSLTEPYLVSRCELTTHTAGSRRDTTQSTDLRISTLD